MGIIYFLVGKSCSGKSTVLDEVLKIDRIHALERLRYHTNRPRRDTDSEDEYYFENNTEFGSDAFDIRGYTVDGGDQWFYWTKDSDLDPEKDYIVQGPTDMLQNYINNCKSHSIVSILIDIDPDIQFERANKREKLNKTPNYPEMYRRLGDDFRKFNAYPNKFDYTLNATCTVDQLALDIYTNAITHQSFCRETEYGLIINTLFVNIADDDQLSNALYNYDIKLETEDLRHGCIELYYSLISMYECNKALEQYDITVPDDNETNEDAEESNEIIKAFNDKVDEIKADFNIAVEHIISNNERSTRNMTIFFLAVSAVIGYLLGKR